MDTGRSDSGLSAEFNSAKSKRRHRSNCAKLVRPIVFFELQKLSCGLTWLAHELPKDEEVYLFRTTVTCGWHVRTGISVSGPPSHRPLC